jgi:hypothetical protein
MTESKSPTKHAARIHPRLVPHEVHMERVAQPQREAGTSEVKARVYCERQQRDVLVEACAQCERFARIDVHEAGYTLLCRSTDSGQEVATGDDPQLGSEPPLPPPHVQHRRKLSIRAELALATLLAAASIAAYGVVSCLN